MKNSILLFILALSIQASAQTCEERETKLLELNGSLSAAFMYNTYAVLGSLADGFGHEVYDKETITDLMTAQRKMAGNMVAVLEKTIADKVFMEQDDRDYTSASIVVVKSFITQVDLFLKYVQNRSQKNLNAFHAERTSNWKQLSKLMGIDD